MKVIAGKRLIGMEILLGLMSPLGPLGITSAVADPQPTSLTRSEAPLPSQFGDDYYVNYFGVFHGGPVDNLSSPYTVDQHGNLSHQAIYFDSEITTAYMITHDIGIGPDIPFQAAPVLGQGLTLGDVGIKTFDKKTIATSNFTLYTNLLLQAPTGQYDQSRGMVVGIKTTPYVMYHLSGTRFTFGSWSEEKVYAGVTSGKLVKLYALPYVNYQLTPALSLNLGYEMETDHNVGSPRWDLTSYETDFQPGFVWTITPKLLLNPYVQLFTGNRVGMDTTAVGAVINATVL